jgi:hypothetical protein
MSRRHTSKPRRHARSKVLEVRVMSPRIAWLGFLNFAGKMTRFACVLGVLGMIGWGIWQGIQHAFYKNPDFRLQVLKLNPNTVMDEGGLANLIGINPTPSLFDIDVSNVTSQLKAMPAIADAHVERHLPGTLVVQVTPREPRAWIVCTAAGLTETHQVGGMLVDRHGFAYRCPELQVESTRTLPIILVPRSDQHPIKVGEKVTHPELAHCFHLLKSACDTDEEAIHWIRSIEQVNAWSMRLVTLDGTIATFGLGDHERQIQSLRAALDHASQKGYAIGTINLIPKRNIPITVRAEKVVPRAKPVPEPGAAEMSQDRRARDLKNLLNRN